METSTADEDDATSSSIITTDDMPKVALAGAAITAIGAFLPWYTVLGVSVMGVEGDGLITLAIAILIGGLVLVRDWTARIMLVSGIGGLIITFVGLYHLTNVSGSGVYLTIVGGIVILVAVGIGYRST